jgi:peroxiredoxin
MKKIILSAMVLASSLAFASADVGQLAPDFSLKGNDGKIHKLSDATKKKHIVVLEWFNEGCPYVHKHYDSGNMQRLQKELTAKGDVEWYTIASSSKGKQGYLATVADAAKMKKDKGMNNTALLLDPGSKIAADFGAKTTPHMFVIDQKGMVAYNGAIDSEDTARPMKVDDYKNNKSIHKYVEDAVAAVRLEKKPEVTSHEPYGCSIKY